MENRVPRMAVYLRISKSDDKRECDSSQSIENQKKTIGQFLANKQELSYFFVPEYFVDDGYSGILTRERPAFCKMLAKMCLGEIQCIIVKDFSRLSRNRLVLARCMEEWFPKYQVRFLSVVEQYDSAIKKCVMENRIRGVFNEYYCHDISEKVKRSLLARKQSGQYATAKAPYGYRFIWQKDGIGKNSQVLVLNEEEAINVQTIFHLAFQGIGATEIAKIVFGDSKKAAFVWRILQNPVYAGNRVWNKYRREGYRTLSVPVPEWKKEGDCHQAVISNRQFEKMQWKKRNGGKSERKGERHFFSGITKCACCGKALCKQRHGKKWLCCRCIGTERMLISIDDLKTVCYEAYVIENEKYVKIAQEEGEKYFLKNLVRCLFRKILVKYDGHVELYVSYDEENSF